MSDQELKTLLDTIETPPADLTGRVLDALRRRKRRFPKGRLLAAALAASAALVGAGRFYEYVMVGADGAVEEARMASSSVSPAKEWVKSARPENRPARVPEQRSYLDFSLRLDPQGAIGYTDPSMSRQNGELESYGDLWDVLSGAKVGLPAPAELPQNWAFENGFAAFFFPPELLDLPQKELFDGGNGFLFQVFQLPESIRENVDSYWAAFSCGDALFTVEAGLSEQEEKLIAPGEAKREIVELGGRKAVYVDDSLDGRKQVVFFTGKIPAVPYADPFDLGAAERENDPLTPWRQDAPRAKPRKYKYFYCTVSAQDADRETLLEFANSLTVPASGSDAPDVPNAEEPVIDRKGNTKVFLLS